MCKSKNLADEAYLYIEKETAMCCPVATSRGPTKSRRRKGYICVILVVGDTRVSMMMPSDVSLTKGQSPLIGIE